VLSLWIYPVRMDYEHTPGGDLFLALERALTLEDALDPAPTEIDQEEELEELWREDDGTDHDGWFCVQTGPFPCPAEGCTFVAQFMTAVHLILVWEEKDDPNLLSAANAAKKVGRDPRAVPYRRSFGPSASFYAWEAAGRPVHGIRKVPAN
jgi:hypothetical protein